MRYSAMGGDIQYARDMIKHHQDAVGMSQKLLRGSARPEIKSFAEKVIEAQSKEIKFLLGWLKENA